MRFATIYLSAAAIFLQSSFVWGAESSNPFARRASQTRDASSQTPESVEERPDEANGADLPPPWAEEEALWHAVPDDEDIAGLDVSAPCCGEANCHCPPHKRQASWQPFWVGGGYVHWWLEGFKVPALVTTSPANTAQTAAGVLGQPGTNILFGIDDLNTDGESGGSVHLGFRLTACPDLRVEFRYMSLAQMDSGFLSESDGSTILARPFFNAETGAEDSSLIAFPSLLEGEVAVIASTEYDTAEFSIRHTVGSSRLHQVDLFAGFRYQQLDDGLRVNDSLTSLDPSSGTPVGTTIESLDRFDTSNDFVGGQLGVSSLFRQGCWSWELLARLALGNTNSDVSIDGSTTTTTNGASATNAGGLLALPSNIGTYSTNEFSVVPELSLGVKYRVNRYLEASVGYSFLYWSGVARPGEQIDSSLNLSQLPPGPFTGAERPEFNFNTTDVWMHGLRCGLEYRH